MDVNSRIAARVRALRDAHGYSLDSLAQRSGVSRSSISLIERGQSSPTAVVLDKLATALGVSVASMFQDVDAAPQECVPVVRALEQIIWTDPDSGYVRRAVSPPSANSPLQLVDVRFPGGQKVAFDTAQRSADIHQQIWMIEGVMEFTVGSAHWQLAPGDCLAMRLDRPIVFHNPTRKAARYLVALVVVPAFSKRTFR
jgi:transcriptional regulator with XRE-family HTH domain